MCSSSQLSASPLQAPLQQEPELTSSTKRKITMLPELKRQQLVERQESKRAAPSQSSQSETLVQSSHRPADLDLSVSQPPKSGTIRYTISNNTTALSAVEISSQAEVSHQSGQDSAVAAQQSESNYTITVADLNMHRGETASIKPPVLVSDDLKSRLESLRQFREWNTRIHNESRAHGEMLGKIGSQPSPDLLPDPQTAEQRMKIAAIERSSSDLGHRSPRLGSSTILERVIYAPTPFCSPQVTPLPVSTSKEGHPSHPASSPISDLPGLSAQYVTAQVRPRAHSRTIIISSETPDSQVAPPSRSKSQKTSNEQGLRRANSKSRAHPPISFPRDFYERFPNAENYNTSIPEEHFRTSSKTTPGVSPKTLPSIPKVDQTVPENIEPLATTLDKQGRPNFYTTTHYFTDCPHTSPPANRPLDPKAQPRPDSSSYPTKSGITRSIIPGSCFNCDVADRRAREDEAIRSSTTVMTELADELAGVLDDLELGESEDDEAEYIHDKHAARLLGQSRFREDKDDLDHETNGMNELPPLSDDPEVTNTVRRPRLSTREQNSYLKRMTVRVRDLEAQIDRLRVEQDERVKEIWFGFTPRWGPGTLGVQRRRSANVSSQTAPVSAGQASQKCEAVERDSREDSVQLVRVEASDEDGSDHAIGSDSPDVVSRGTSRARSGSSQSRSTTPTTNSSVISNRDVPGSWTPGEGKMKIGWIRE